MAVLDAVPGLEVAVHINGASAAEYNDPEGNDSYGPGTVTKYIESAEGTEFSIVTQVKHNYAWGYRGHELVTHVSIDGKHYSATRIFPSSGLTVTRDTGMVERQPDTQQWVLRKYRFAVVTIVETATATYSSAGGEALHDLGSITVEVKRMIRGEKYKSTSKVGKPTEPADLLVSEKALKGRSISHGMQLSDGEPTSPLAYADRRLVHIDDRPLAIFRFVYRSREALMKEMVIPREASPDPLDTLSDTELRRLARERLNMTFKSENKPEPRVKREREETRDLTAENIEARDTKKVRRLTPIDLTDD